MTPLGVLREQAFSLTYGTSMTLADVAELGEQDREWYVRRLGEQLEREAKAIRGKR